LTTLATVDVLWRNFWRQPNFLIDLTDKSVYKFLALIWYVCILRLPISTHVYFAKNAAYFSFNSWLSFQRLCRLLWALVLSQAMRPGGSTLGRGREGPSKLWLGPKFSRTLGTFYIMVRYCIKTAKGIHCMIIQRMSLCQNPAWYCSTVSIER